MTNPQVKDTLAVMAVSAGVVTLALLIMSVLTDNNWWIVVLIAIATLVFGIRWYQERRPFGGDDERSSRVG
jgi:type II secretory pathway component PulF